MKNRLQQVDTSHSRRLAVVVLMLLHTGVAAFFLIPSWTADPVCLPLDDAYIHLSFARSLATTGVFGFNPGEPSGGSTSPLWVFLLAAFTLTGLPAGVLSALLGAVSFTASGVLLAEIVRTWPGSDPDSDDVGMGIWLGLAAGAGHALCGVTAWHGLSGMETSLFIALGLLAIVLHSQGRRPWAALVAGLLIWTRLEGAALALLLLSVSLWQDIRQRRDRPLRAVFIQAGPTAGLFLALLVFNRVLAGAWLPTTFGGRRWLYGLSSISSAEQWWHFASLHLASWWYYLRDNLYSGSIGGGFIHFLLLVLCLAGTVSLVRRIVSRAFGRESGMPPPIMLFLWILGHNAAYLALLPNMGHAGRYQALNFLLFLILPLLGAFSLSSYFASGRSGGRRKPAAAPAAVSLVVVLILPAGFAWQGHYLHSADQIRTEHMEAAGWIRENTEPDALVAAFDIGVLGYLGEREVLDLGGLIDRDFLPYLTDRRTAEYMRSHGADYLILPGGYEESGGVDFGRLLGLSDARRAGLVRFEPLTRKAVSRSVYDRTRSVAMTASPVLRIYRVHWPAAQSVAD